ncbi:MAG: hypothetical protein IPP66_19700 [Anaerolineales bacterium]|nr:hypothetical protein [Anaerolineales bacterium]
MTTYRKNGITNLFNRLAGGRRIQRGAAWGGMILGALLAFEIFNFSTTQFALLDILGDLKFAGMRWATILAIAFCGIDFAGIARIFTPEQGRDEPAEIWYLLGAWFLAAAMNASLTWWGVSVAIVNHTSASGSAVINAATMAKIVPIFVAVMIMFIRVLLIGTFSVAGERLFSTDEKRASYTNTNTPRPRPVQQQQPTYRPATPTTTPVLRPASSINRPMTTNMYHPTPNPAPKPAQQTSFTRAEPTYHNLSFNGPAESDRSYDV